MFSDLNILIIRVNLVLVTFSKNTLLYKLILPLFNIIFICFYKTIYKYNDFIENKSIIYNYLIILFKFIYKTINKILFIYNHIIII